MNGLSTTNMSLIECSINPAAVVISLRGLQIFFSTNYMSYYFSFTRPFHDVSSGKGVNVAANLLDLALQYFCLSASVLRFSYYIITKYDYSSSVM